MNTTNTPTCTLNFQDDILTPFDALKEKSSIRLRCNADPLQYMYTLAAQRGPVFRWKYITHGPEEWKVEITKIALKNTEPSIGDLVSKDFRKAEVFRKYGIDYCCGGKRSVRETCKSNDIDHAALAAELAVLDTQPATGQDDYASWSPSFLADYIVQKHHRYVENSLEPLLEWSQKVAKVHGHYFTEVVTISHHIYTLAEELGHHMHKEEQVLFPYIHTMEDAQKQGTPLPHSFFNSVEDPIRMMEAEHETAGELMKAMRSLSNGYSPPEGACTTFRVLYAKLEEFEADLHKHIHLENNILFPKAKQMDQELRMA